MPALTCGSFVGCGNYRHAVQRHSQVLLAPFGNRMQVMPIPMRYTAKCRCLITCTTQEVDPRMEQTESEWSG